MRVLRDCAEALGGGEGAEEEAWVLELVVRGKEREGGGGEWGGR